MPMVTPISFHISASGSSTTPMPISALFTRPWRRSSVTQAKARTSTDIQSGNSTPSIISRCAVGRAWVST
jgi:hypothetical protein